MIYTTVCSLQRWILLLYLMLVAWNITAGLVVSNDSLPLGLWLSRLWANCLETGINSRHSAYIEYGTTFAFLDCWCYHFNFLLLLLLFIINSVYYYGGTITNMLQDHLTKFQAVAAATGIVWSPSYSVNLLFTSVELSYTVLYLPLPDV